MLYLVFALQLINLGLISYATFVIVKKEKKPKRNIPDIFKMLKNDVEKLGIGRIVEIKGPSSLRELFEEANRDDCQCPACIARRASIPMA